MKANRCAAPIRGVANGFQFPFGAALRIELAIEFASARDFDDQIVRKRIHHRYADPVQAAGGLISLVGEFAARMKGGQDNLQGGLVLKLRMRINGNAAPVIGHA